MASIGTRQKREGRTGFLTTIVRHGWSPGTTKSGRPRLEMAVSRDFRKRDEPEEAKGTAGEQGQDKPKTHEKCAMTECFTRCKSIEAFKLWQLHFQGILQLSGEVVFFFFAGKLIVLQSLILRIVELN